MFVKEIFVNKTMKMIWANQTLHCLICKTQKKMKTIFPHWKWKWNQSFQEIWLPGNNSQIPLVTGRPRSYILIKTEYCALSKNNSVNKYLQGVSEVTGQAKQTKIN